MVRLWRWAGLVFVAAATPAQAHSPVPGVEGFYVGLIHPYSTPAQALLMLGCALLVGGFSGDKGRWVLPGFLLASLIGLAIGPRILAPDPAMFALAAMSCALAALLPGRAVALAALCLTAGGFLIGQVSIPDDGPTRDRLFTMSGSMVGANLGLLYLYGITQVLRERYTQPWVGIAFRVAAAWLGAISLVMLALDYAQASQPVT